MSEITITITPVQVGCSRCGAQPEDPCINKKGERIKSLHPERKLLAEQLVAKATGNSPEARYARWRLRHLGAPRAKLPHGTMAAYRRHKAHGTEPCKACVEAARKNWAESRRKQRTQVEA
jgi:hypothetical protein